MCLTLCHPMNQSPQAPLSTGFFRHGYWSELSCPLPGDLPNPGIEPSSLMVPVLAGRFFTTSATWEALPIYRLFFIHSTFDGHRGCFHISATINNAAVNTGWVLTSFWISVFVFFKYIPRSGITCFILNFWGATILFPKVAASVYIPTAVLPGSLYSTSSPGFIICVLFYDSYSDRWYLVVFICISW